MADERGSEYFKDIATYYDPQEVEGNINYELAKHDLIFHHHSGIVYPGQQFPEMSEEELLKVLHEQENTLTKFGTLYLDTLTSEMIGLDAGCGRGGSSILINQLYKCKMLGVTLSYKQAQFGNRVANQLGTNQATKFIQANMLELPLQPESFDFIWACESTEHIPDLDAMFLEFNRVARSSAPLVVIAACGVPEHPDGRKYMEMANKWYHMMVHSRREYLDAAASNGWRVKDEVDLTALTIPYWELRTRSKYKTGVEALVEGYRIGAGEYRLFSFLKN